MTAICTAGTCATISPGTSSGIASVTYNSTGVYYINFVSGVFHNAPGCIISSKNLGSSNGICNAPSSGITASSAAVVCQQLATGFGVQNDGFDAQCWGN
jgi:hypothetical protein